MPFLSALLSSELETFLAKDNLWGILYKETGFTASRVHFVNDCVVNCEKSPRDFFFLRENKALQLVKESHSDLAQV